MNFQNKKVAILGLGIEGLALYDFLKDKVLQLTLCDELTKAELLQKTEGEMHTKLEIALGDEKVEKKLGADYLADLSAYDIVFRSPSIYFNHPALLKAKKQGVLVTSQIKLFFDLCPCPIIGVTGTKGKGTTASLIFEILKNYFQHPTPNIHSNSNSQIPNVYLAGNIGYPAITIIPELKKYDFVILELSNFQLADLDKSPHIAVVTNLSVDHLDYHHDIAEYHEAKKSILRHQSDRDFAILNYNSTFDAEFLKTLKGQIRYFSENNTFADAAVIGDTAILDPKERHIEVAKLDEIKLVGLHNLENIAAASLVADTLDIPADTIKQAATHFTGLPHRLELVAEINGVKYINDSFATNPEPTKAAIEAFSQPEILILGGSSKGADFSEMASLIAAKKIKAVISIGVEGEKIAQALKSVGYIGRIIEGKKDILAIIRQAKEIAKRGDIVIFSPACASFDMFKNYKDRGEKFKQAVLTLKMPSSGGRDE